VLEPSLPEECRHSEEVFYMERQIGKQSFS
jgi:hypothetical protein